MGPEASHDAILEQKCIEKVAPHGRIRTRIGEEMVVRLHKRRQNKTRQGKTRQDETRQDKTGQEKARQDERGQVTKNKPKAGHYKTR